MNTESAISFVGWITLTYTSLKIKKVFFSSVVNALTPDQTSIRQQ